MNHVNFFAIDQAVHSHLTNMWACDFNYAEAVDELQAIQGLTIAPRAWAAFNALLDAQYEAEMLAQQLDDEANTVTLYIWPCGTWTDNERERDELLESKSDDYGTLQVIHRPEEPFEILEDAVQQYLDGWAMQDIHNRLEAL